MGDVQTQVRKAIDEMVETGAERGLQGAVYRGGEQVVAAVAGGAETVAGRKVGSVTRLYDSSRGQAAPSTLAHSLVERGLFRDATPVVEAWPEFGAPGKDMVTVRPALGHTAGVP